MSRNTVDFFLRFRVGETVYHQGNWLFDSSYTSYVQYVDPGSCFNVDIEHLQGDDFNFVVSW